MIIYVDLEHDHLRADLLAGAKSLAACLQAKYRLEEASGQPCLIVRYDQVDPRLVKELGARAVVVSGCFTDFQHYSKDSLAGLQDVFRESSVPLLGFCAGCQMLAKAFAGDIGPIGRISDEVEHDLAGMSYADGWQQEFDFMPVTIEQNHPLVAGISSEAIFYQQHYWEIKRLPPEFQNLATSSICPIQIIAHRERPLFGVQFHAEKYDDVHPDGRKLLENFFQITF